MRSSRVYRRSFPPRRASRDFTCVSNNPRNSFGTPGSRITMRPFASSHSPRRGCRPGIRKHGGTLGNQSLAGVDLRHHPAGTKPPEPLLNVVQHRFIRMKLAPEQLRHRLTRAIVVCGTKASRRNDYFSSVQRLTERRGPHVFRRVAHDRFVQSRECQVHSARR